MSDLCDTDVYGWAMRQAGALRRRSGNELGWDRLAEEIESAGGREIFAAAWRTARLAASGETDLPAKTFPEAPCFTYADALDEAFWPEPA